MAERRSLPAMQQAAALPIALFIVAIAGLMAVSAASIAMLSTRMAAAESARLDVFNAAENALAVALRTASLSELTAWRQTVTTPAGVTVESSVTFDSAGGMTAPPDGGYSLGEGGAGFTARHYRVLADATGPRGARAQHTQDFYVLGPPAS